MITRNDALKILAAVKENHAKLESCVGPHEFVLVESGPGGLPRKHQCARCGGKLDSVHVSWYNKGMEHIMEARQK